VLHKVPVREERFSPPLVHGHVAISLFQGGILILIWGLKFVGAWSAPCWIGNSIPKCHASAMIDPNIASAMMKITSFFRASDCCISNIYPSPIYIHLVGSLINVVFELKGIKMSDNGKIGILSSYNNDHLSTLY
jgi:hypothetical protein